MNKFILENLHEIGLIFLILILLFLITYSYWKIKHITDYKILIWWEESPFEVSITAMKENELISALLGKNKSITKEMAEKKLKEKFGYSESSLLKVIIENKKL